MKTKLCEELGIEVPLFAFTRSAEVVVTVSKLGGFGVLGAIGWKTEDFAERLRWIDEHIDGKPYGVDVVMPAGFVSAGGDGMGDPEKLHAMLPEEHRNFINRLLDEHDVPPLPEGATAHQAMQGWTDQVSRKQVEIALEHPIKLIANALGPPPEDIVKLAHDKGVLIAALVGSAKHAEKQAAAGVDIIVAQGTEAGGHTGDVSTFVLVPEVVEAVAPRHVLAAGGIGSGKQLAAALALGAQGAWTGSIWLGTEESLEPAAIRERLVAASSRDTVRSRAISGKPARQLKTRWTEVWDAPENPDPLPMPLQFMLTAEAVARVHHEMQTTGGSKLLMQPAGQIVGRIKQIRPAADVMKEITAEARETLRSLGQLAG